MRTLARELVTAAAAITGSLVGGGLTPAVTRAQSAAPAAAPAVAPTAAPASAGRVGGDDRRDRDGPKDGPGCVVAVARDGRVLLERADGMANLEHGIPLGPASVMNVASIAKQFTAAAVLLLVEDGALALEDDVRRYVPGLPDYRVVAGAPVTIRDLLYHTSGLPDHWALLDAAGWRLFRDRIAPDDALALLRRWPRLAFRPGTRHAYANSNYLLLAEVVRRASGRPLAAFARERMFGPLGLTRTAFRDDYDAVVPGQAAAYEPIAPEASDSARGSGRAAGSGHSAHDTVGYRAVGTHDEVVGPAGLLTTAGDLVRWTQALHAGRVGGPTFRRLARARGRLADGSSIGYGAGLAHGEHRGVATVGHGGREGQYVGNVEHFPDANLSVACLCNGPGADPYRTVRALAASYLPASLPASVRLEPAAPPPAAAPAAPSAPLAAAARLGVAVGTGRLAELAGTYTRPAGDALWRVWLREGRLWMWTGNEERPLAPLTAERFLVEGTEYSAVFERARSGRPRRVVISRPGGEPAAAEYDTAAGPAPAAARLAAYAGVYYNAALNVVWELALEGEAPDGGALVLRRARAAPARLQWLRGDRFRVSDGPFRFARAAGDQVTGFTFAHGGVGPLDFVRVGLGVPAAAPGR